jgi:hypothetical protein
MTAPWWQTRGIVPLPVDIRLEPAPGSLRAAHGRALIDSLRDRVVVEPDRDEREEAAS